MQSKVGSVFSSFSFALLVSGNPLLLEAAEPQKSGLNVQIQDSSGAVLSAATVILRCTGVAVQQGATDQNGDLLFTGLPNSAVCTVEAKAKGLGAATRTVEIEGDQTQLTIQLMPATAKTEVVVYERANEVEGTVTAAQGTLGAQQLGQIPVFNPSTGFTEILTRTTPGVAADANGFAHPLGEHADTSISLDGQPITDQQAKVFSNQLDPNIIESLTATTGAPSAEFGGKTSLVASVTTKSGLGQKLFGQVSSDYGSFGTWSESLRVGAGNRRWGNFFASNTSGSGRFLDTPEFRPIHARGNSGGLFDRIDWQPKEKDLLHLNLSIGRSWFQTPNSYDAAGSGQDQRSQIWNGNAAFGWKHVFTPQLLSSVTPFYRRDRSQYFPSRLESADLPATLAQDRTLANTGVRAEIQYSSKVHTGKLGGTYSHTMLSERFSIGLTDPLYNPVCLDTSGNPVAAVNIRSMEACSGAGFHANPQFVQELLPFDLSRHGTLYRFDKQAHIAETALYAQDEIRFHNLILSPGLRYDIYKGLSRGNQFQPRLGMAWRTPGLGTLLRASYARLYETPYNENLILANESREDTSTANPFASFRSERVRPGTRNQFNVGLEQHFGKHVSVDADYYWKFTRNAFDFDTLFNTPITFSVAWRKSKIDGLAVRVNLLETHGFTAYSVMGHVRSRFFTPEVGGLIFNSVPPSGVFRIDHGEEFEHTTNLRYQTPAGLLGKYRPWINGVWRFNSGLALPDTVPVYTDALALTADQQAQMGLHCGSDFATLAHPIRECTETQFGATRVRIPPLGTQDDDRNPVRVAPRTLFDLSLGEDRLYKVERLTVGVRFSILNITNQVALYNFLSAFSGTHFVPPRSYQAGLQLSF